MVCFKAPTMKRDDNKMNIISNNDSQILNHNKSGDKSSLNQSKISINSNQSKQKIQ